MSKIEEEFGNKIRIRVNGLCYQDDKILLVKHNLEDYKLWAPPGGGLVFGETIEESLKREFREETCLDVIPGEFLFYTEFIKQPLHAIELFYKIESFTGEPSIGTDPEIKNVTIIEDMDFFNQEMLSMIPNDELHSILKDINNPLELLKFRGDKK
ncbi:MAG: NUDIX hydrolase [Bacteroidota bacterium]